LGSPHSAAMSISSDTIYFDANDHMSEDGTNGRGLTRPSSYQDGIDDYPSSPNDSGSPHTWGRATSGGMADPDSIVEPETAPPNCLPSISLPRILSGNDRPRNQTFVRLERPPAGSSVKQRELLPPPPPPHEAVPEGAPAHGASLVSTPSGRASPVQSWEDPGSGQFMVRTKDYIRTKKKDLSEAAIYKLLAMDLYSFDFKLGHIAKHVQLPPAPQLGDLSGVPREERLPPLLVVNIQLPDYPASLWAKGDGPGCSLVFYFGLPEGWTPDHESNKAALGLAQRFMHNGKEADGTPTRDRLKLMPRVVNVDEWAQSAPLSGPEVGLLRRYNDKPLLTRPQQKFFLTPTYLEVDLDIHNYAYLARKAFTGFTSRLQTVVFDNAFIIQGNRPEELPEQVLAAARVTGVDFEKVRPFPADTMDHLGDHLDEDGRDSWDSAAER